MTEANYTALTFAPIQGFIEKSRKLRDLYGSSFILSYLACAICERVEATLEKSAVISPARINVTQGTSNLIIVKGAFSPTAAETAFYDAWGRITKVCREWIEEKLIAEYSWRSDWELWTNHAWEFFCQTGETISQARYNLMRMKKRRNWTAVNWLGESSSLSGTDAIAWPGMGTYHPKNSNYHDANQASLAFYAKLREILGESLLDEREQLSIPELVKRLVLVDEIAEKLGIRDEVPKGYKQLNRLEGNNYTGWFKGDGDRIGVFLDSLPHQERQRNQVSKAMREWGRDLTEDEKKDLPFGRIIYAGGDDFFGVFFRDSAPELTGFECVNWFAHKFRELWAELQTRIIESLGEDKSTYQSPITVSVGFVWAAPDIPQRDILQHCREAEESAKKHGRDRLALRVLFNGGNWVEWVCPWQHLNILEKYQDREGGKNWRHIYEDIAVLESRHAFSPQNTDVALALFTAYFGKERDRIFGNQDLWWNEKDKTGILGEQSQYQNIEQQNDAINDWIINLAKIGFHLYDQS
jgi:CRISPR-associated protein Cmr2